MNHFDKPFRVAGNLPGCSFHASERLCHERKRRKADSCKQDEGVRPCEQDYGSHRKWNTPRVSEGLDAHNAVGPERPIRRNSRVHTAEYAGPPVYMRARWSPAGELRWAVEQVCRTKARRTASTTRSTHRGLDHHANSEIRQLQDPRSNPRAPEHIAGARIETDAARSSGTHRVGACLAHAVAAGQNGGPPVQRVGARILRRCGSRAGRRRAQRAAAVPAEQSLPRTLVDGRRAITGNRVGLQVNRSHGACARAGGNKHVCVMQAYTASDGQSGKGDNQRVQ